MLRRCLLIDDQNQQTSIYKMIEVARQNGLELEVKQFNVGSTFEEDLLTDGRIDIAKVLSEYKNRFGGLTFHLVALDRDLTDDTINGLELVRQFNSAKILKNTPKIIYSGNLDDLLKDELDVKDGKSADLIIRKLKTLVNSDIRAFFDRTDYEQDIVNYLKDQVDKTDLIIEDILSKHPDLIFKTALVRDSFKNKTFSEILSIIKDNPHLENELKNDLVEQVIAYLTIDIQ